jgi:hypothetical protein
MQKIYVVGHGKWVPLNGWIKIPPQVTMTFYSNIYTALQNTAVWEILEGKGLGDIPKRKFFEGQWIENQTLSWHSVVHISYYDEYAAKNPDEKLLGNKAKFLYIWKKDGRTTLEEIFEEYADQIHSDGGWDLHWACCRAVVKADQLVFNDNEFQGTVPLMRVKAGGVTEAMPDNSKVTGMHVPNESLVTRCTRPITLPKNQ